MKKIIRLVTAVFLISLGTQSFAQVFGIQAGVNMATMLSKDDNINYSKDYKVNPGFNAGVTAEFGFNNFLSLETGLIFETKGYKGKEIANMSTSWNAYYLDIPLNLKINFNLPIKIYGKIGSYVGFGLFGKDIFKTSNSTVNTDLEWGTDSENDLKRFDFGGNVGLGIGLGPLEIGATYGRSLISASPKTNNGYNAYHNIFSVSIAYKFLNSNNQ